MFTRFRGTHRRAVASGMAVAVAAIGAFTAGSSPAGASESGPLAITGFDDIVLDEANGHLFLSQGLDAGGVLVTDLTGDIVTELTDLVDARRLTLSDDGSTVWVPLPRTNEVVGIDTGSLEVSARHALPVDVCPGSVAEVAGYLAVGHSCNQWARSGSYGGVGVLDRATGGWEPLTFSGPFYQPIVAASPGSADVFVTGDVGLSPTTLFSVTAIGGEPDLITDRRDTGSNLRDLAVSPDGSTVVQASGSPYIHNSYTVPFLADSVSYESTSYPNAAVYSADGSTVVTGSNSSYGTDVRTHVAGAGAADQSFELGAGRTLEPSGLAVSNDGSIVFAISEGDGVWRLHDLRPPTTTSIVVTGPSSSYAGEPITVAGTLIAADGRPMGGRTIELTRALPGEAPRASGSVDTESDGSFTAVVYEFRPGPVTISAAYAGNGGEGSSTASITVSNIPKVESTLTIDVPATADEGTTVPITGTLAFADGRPTAGSVVDLIVSSSLQYEQLLESVVVDADGSFASTFVPVVPGTTVIDAIYDGGPETTFAGATGVIEIVADTTSTLTIGAPASVDLGETIAISGQLSISDGVIEPDLYIEIRTQTVTGEILSYGYALTDDFGAFSTEIVAQTAGTITVTADFHGAGLYAPSSAFTTVDVVAPPEPEVTFLTLDGPDRATAGDTVRLFGQLTDSGAAPLGGRSVAIVRDDPEYGSSSVTIAHVTTTPNGSFDIDVVLDVEDAQFYSAHFAGDADYTAASADHAIGVDAIETTLTLNGPTEATSGTPFQLSGRLTPQSAGGSGAAIDISRSTPTGPQYVLTVATTADGTFTFTDTLVDEGSVTYTALFHGAGGRESALAVHTITISRAATDTSLSAPATATIGDSIALVGAVSLDAGEPIDGVGVRIDRRTAAGTATVGFVTTGADGSFSFDEVATTSGIVEYTAVFEGTTVLADSQASAHVEVSRATTEMTLTATEQSGRRNRGRYDLSAILSGAPNDRSITIYAQPASGGQFVVASGTSPLAVEVKPDETTTYLARFDGDDTYLGATDSLTITVKQKGGGKPRK